MKFEIDDQDTLMIISALRHVHLFQIRYFAENPDLTEGLPTPEEIAESYNRFLGQIHQQGKLKILTPMKIKKYDVNLN